jgi:hypothetical protein
VTNADGSTSRIHVGPVGVVAPGVRVLWGAGPGPARWTELRLLDAGGATVRTCSYRLCPLGP